MSLKNSSAASSFALDALARFAPELEHFESTLTNYGAESPQLDTTDAVPKSDDMAQAIQEIVSAIQVNSPFSLPSHRTLLKLLDNLDKAFDESASMASSQLESLRVAALARVTYAAYSLVLEALLQDAAKLADEAWYWTEIEESTYGTATFLVQTFPQRLASLVRETLEMAAENATQTVRGTIDRASSESHGRSPFPDKATFKRTLRILLDTPNMMTGILFPYTFQSESTVTLATAQEKHADSSKKDGQISVTGAQIAKRRASKSLRSAAFKFSPLHLVKHEARCKRHGLIHERDALAEKLGQLALEQVAPSKQAKGSIESLDVDQAQEQVLKDLSEKLSRMASALDAATDSTDGEVKVQLDTSTSPAMLSASLRTLLNDILPRYSSRTQLILSPTRFGQPSSLTQNWPSLVIYPLGLLLASRYISNNWDGLSAKASEAKETIRGFLMGWVWEPCVHLLDTIRHGDESGVIISRESLNSDLQSLERMVASFTHEQYGISGPELDAVASRVREGDLTHVLKIYESEMKSPLKSAVSGSLIRSLLIQIQKAKVDLEVAMSGIDRLLRSQQLLFGAVGIAPALGVLYVTNQWVRGKLAGVGGIRARRSGKAMRMRAWEAMRRIDRLLSTPSSDSDLPALTHGLLLLDLSLLRSSSGPLLHSASRGKKAVVKRLQRQFLQDVRDLESSGPSTESMIQPGIGYWARRAAVERMWCSWSGILQLER